MKDLLYKVLLVGGLLIYSVSYGQVVTKDKFVFKVSQEVYSVKDIQNYHNSLKYLKCVYPESLVYEVFFTYFPKKKSLFKIDKKFSSDQKNAFYKVLPFFEFLSYAQSQKINVRPELYSYFDLQEKRSKCENYKNQHQRGIIKLEVFIRSRFIPEDKNQKMTSEDIKKTKSAIMSLVKSISNQIEDSVFW